MKDPTYYNGGPDDYGPFVRRQRPAVPTHVQCDWCAKWTGRQINVALIWFFCSPDCRQEFLDEPHEIRNEAFDVVVPRQHGPP